MADNTITTPPPVTSNPSATGANLSSDAAKTYIQNQIADKQAQVDTLNKAGITQGDTTTDIAKNASGGYDLTPAGEYTSNVNALKTAMDNYTAILNGSNPAQDLTNSENLAIAKLSKPDANVVKPMTVYQGQEAQIQREAAPQIANATQQQTNKQNAALQAIKNQQTLLSLQPNNPANLKSAADLANEQATTAKTNADIANLPTPEEAKAATEADIANKQANTAKIYSDIANTGVSQSDVSDMINNLNDYNGTQYITPSDLSGLNTTQKAAFKASADSQGIKSLDAKQSDALTTIKTAQADLQTLSGAINDPNLQLPKGASGQPVAYANAAFNKVLQANPTLASYYSDLSSAIPIAGGLKGVATGGGGSGGKLITLTMSMLPQPTDTLPTAQKKLDNIYSLLDNGATSIVGNGGQVSVGGKQYKVGQAISDGNLTLTVNSDKKTLKGSDGKTYDLKGNIIK